MKLNLLQVEEIKNNMREIKFRAWDEKHNRMKTGVESYLGAYLPPNGDIYEQHILMQYTGLKDKNGKEIYEGDILSITTPSGRKCTSQVVWEQPPVQKDNVHPYKDLNGIVWWGGWQHKVIGDGTNYSLSEDLFEIIGNIYEHPNLTK